MQVKHSQRLSDPTLQPWVAIQKDGQVMFGHCTCMAGLGEVCSHIAATMFAMESAVRHLKSRTCTDGPRQWGQTVVSGGKAIFARGSAIDFTNPERKRQLASCGKGPAPTKSARQQVSACKTVDDEVGKQLYEDLSKSGVKSAILSIIPGYCENYVPKSILLNLPPPLTELYRPEYLDLPYQDLLKKCEEAFHQLAIDDEQAAYIEAETRKQSKSKLWFHMRAGRVTASRFKAAARTDPANPSLSLIKQICYPEAYKFTSAATDNLFPVNLNTTQMSGSEVFLHEDRWGCKHESVARKIYGDQAKASHACFQLEDAGLQIHPEHPYLGASPDGLVSCQCCGRGVLEIKCPYCKRHLSPEQATNEPGFCLENVGGRVRLKRDHTYYYQVQAQLHLTANRSYCDFVVWTKDSELFVERISKDSNCFLKALENITLFFKVGVLPELMGKWFTRPVHSNTTEPVAGASTHKRNSCFCQQPENGIMVKCQSLCCNVERFHLQCLGLKNPPKNKNWLCPNCRKIKSVLKNCSTNS